MWSSGGSACTHSIEDSWYDENKAGRLLIILSQRIKIIKTTATSEIIEPMEEIMFHDVYASG